MDATDPSRRPVHVVFADWLGRLLSPGYGLTQAQPIPSGLLGALRVLHQRV